MSALPLGGCRDQSPDVIQVGLEFSSEVNWQVQPWAEFAVAGELTVWKLTAAAARVEGTGGEAARGF